MSDFLVGLARTFDVTEEAQAMEDDHLRRRLRERAEYVRQWCEKVIAETDSEKPLEKVRLDLPSIAYPIAELMQYAGAVDNLRHTRIGSGEVITIRRAPVKAERKRGRR